MRIPNAAKISAYKWVIRKLKREYPNYYMELPTVAPYVCDLLQQYCEINLKIDMVREDLISTHFSEFMECRPENSETKWWGEDDLSIILRIQAIEWCIDQLTPKNK